MLEGRDLLAAVIVTNITDDLGGDTSSIAALMSNQGADGTISLREAILASNNTAGTNSITFDPVTSGTPILLTGGRRLEITNGVTITGLGAANTTVSGGGNSRIFEIATTFADPRAVTLDGLTLTGGKDAFGGAIRSQFAFLTVSNSTIRDNHVDGGIFRSTAGKGGAIEARSGVVIINSTISGNSASNSGGGIYSLGAVTVIDSTISGNSAGGSGYGGGIFSTRTVTISNSTISDNFAFHGGGGIAARGNVTINNSTVSRNRVNTDWGGGGIYGGFFDNGSVTVINSTIADNFAGFGGGIFAEGSVTVINSTITRQLLAVQGGGIYSLGALTVNNSTISGNSANFGGGIYGDGDVTFRNSIVAGNVAWIGPDGSDGPDLFTWGTPTVTNSLIGDNSGTILWPAPVGTPDDQGNLIGTATAPIDPLLGPLGDNGGPTQTMALLTGSPALNAGNNALAVDAAGMPLAFDQRGPGFARISGGRVDMGAYEFQANEAPTITVPAAQTANEDVDKAISGLSVGDPDGDDLTVTLQAGHGSLTLGSTAGLIVSGNGSGSVTLAGSVADLNAALAGLVYRGGLNFSGCDTLAITARDGSLTSSNSVALTVQSADQQAGDLQTQVNALLGSGVMNQGQADSLNVKLELKDNAGDIGKAESFLNQVAAYLSAGILTQEQADALTAAGKILRTSLTRR